MIPTSRCTIYPDTFIGACLFSALRNTSGNDVPSQWITRGVARREKKKGRREKRWKKSRRWRKRRWTRETREEESREREKRATAITGDENEREEREREKNDRCINTARPSVYIYLCVASQCWAFVVLDDGRLSRETTSEAFASSSLSSSSLSLLRPPPPPTPSFSSHTPALCVSRVAVCVCVSSLPNQFLPEWISRRGTRLSDP